MELKMNEYQLPEQILFNYEELKAELTEKVQHYETLVYTDDQIKEAKADRAALNKLKKALSDEQIRREKEYMKPFDDFKSKINEIISIIDKPVAVIDKQIREYEDKRQQEKLEEIKKLWFEMEVPDGLTLDKVFNDRMLNASFNMKHVKQCFIDAIDRFNRDMAVLVNLSEYSFEAQQTYISSLDLSKAMNEANRLSRLAKQKAEYEAEQERLKAEEAKKAAQAVAPDVKEEPVSEMGKAISSIERQAYEKAVNAAPAKQWVAFQALLSTEDALALKEFFNSRNIEFRAV
jgi:CHASE3 domain sensor protein